MNKLREIVDHLEYKRLLVNNAFIDAGKEDYLISEIKRRAESSICFSSEIECIDGFKPVGDLGAKLPYKNCYFEFRYIDDGSQVAGVLAEQNADGLSWNCIALQKKNTEWVAIGAAGSDGERVVWTPNSLPEAYAQAVVWAVASFVSALQCSNVSAVEEKVGEKLNKARAKRGKAPLFSTWTLVLHGKSSASSSLGGTHASPRVHLRRGHPRQVRPGVWTWVQPCVVGNKDLGVIHKDYQFASAAP